MAKKLKLTLAQQRTIDAWIREGFTLKQTRKVERSKDIYVELNRWKTWPFPWFCPYAIDRYEQTDVELHISTTGTARPVSHEVITGDWQCDWPQSSPYYPSDKIIAGTHPMIPIRSTTQMELPL